MIYIKLCKIFLKVSVLHDIMQCVCTYLKESEISQNKDIFFMCIKF